MRSHVERLYGEDILHGVEFQLIEVAVNGCGEEGFEFVCAGFDLELGGFIGG